MVIYLLVKTHNKTGLKYLCQTTRDPHKYNGSGIYWKRHLKVHGKDHSTEILKECTTKEELKYWGIFYSNLWNVVKSEDWANLKPEEGDGMSSETAKVLNNNPSTKKKNSDSNKVTQNMPSVKENNLRRQKEVFSKELMKKKFKTASIKRWEDSTYHEKQKAAIKKGVNTPEAKANNKKAQLIALNKPEVKEKQRKAHSGKNNARYDHIIYKFIHKDGTFDECTKHDLYTKYNLSSAHVCNLTKNKLKSVKGWKLSQ